MSQSQKNKKKRPTRSIILVALAWAFISGQALLAAGSFYNYNTASGNGEITEVTMPWGLVSQGANRVRLVAAQAQPDVLGNVAVFLAVANVLGLVGLTLGLVSWSRSQHTSGKLTIAIAVMVILVNSMLNLPYA
ncbi:MAG: hypothetical protein ACYTAS_10770 [Planctomycetota bacterium]|jgi:hypothetical protein